MANIKELRQNGATYPLADEQARQNIGDLSKLKTAAKNSLVDAVNEVKEQGGNGGGTKNYTALSNKPKINGVELNGDKSLADFGITTGGEIDTSAFILPNVSLNLWDGTYKDGQLVYNTGAIDETVTTAHYAEMEIEPNTDYIISLAHRNWFVLYEDDAFVYNAVDYTRVEGYEPVKFNSGNNTRIRFQCDTNNIDNPAVANSYLLRRVWLIKGTEIPRKVGAYGMTFAESDLPPHSFYRSVASKLTDLTNPFKPTAVAMIGDSITAGYHSYNHAYITNCYAKLFGDYLLERFNGKVYNIPFFDENVEAYYAEYYKGLETGCVFPAGSGYAKIRFYGSYLSVNAYNGQKPDTVMTVYIDDEEYASYNFAENDSTKWETDVLSVGYHTAKITFSARCTMGSIGVKKHVTFSNKAESGINSTTVRTWFADSRKFDNDDIIFCMIGTNDRMSGNVGLYDFNVRQVFKHGLEAMGKKVILMSATPSPREAYAVGAEDTEAEYLYKMRDVVAWVNLIGGKENEQVISFYNWLIDYAAEHDIEIGTFFNDGLHPTEACHDLMFKHLLRECGFGIEM